VNADGTIKPAMASLALLDDFFDGIDQMNSSQSWNKISPVSIFDHSSNIPTDFYFLPPATLNKQEYTNRRPLMEGKNAGKPGKE